MSAPDRRSHIIGPLEQVPVGEGREFLVNGRRVAVFRLRDGSVAATEPDCPHRAGPLADGIVGMDAVVCPLHARRFCLRSGVAQNGEGDGIDIHPTHVDKEGQIVVALPVGMVVA